MDQLFLRAWSRGLNRLPHAYASARNPFDKPLFLNNLDNIIVPGKYKQLLAVSNLKTFLKTVETTLGTKGVGLAELDLGAISVDLRKHINQINTYAIRLEPATIVGISLPQGLIPHVDLISITAPVFLEEFIDTKWQLRKIN